MQRFFVYVNNRWNLEESHILSTSSQGRSQDFGNWRAENHFVDHGLSVSYRAQRLITILEVRLLDYVFPCVDSESPLFPLLCAYSHDLTAFPQAYTSRSKTPLQRSFGFLPVKDQYVGGTFAESLRNFVCVLSLSDVPLD